MDKFNNHLSPCRRWLLEPPLESSLSHSEGGYCLYSRRTDKSSLEAGEPSGYEHELWNQAAQVQIPASLFAHCGSLGKLTNLSKSSFLIL